MRNGSETSSVINSGKWRVFENLITVDGPDGSGKTTLTEMLASNLKSRLGSEQVLLVRPTRFDASPEAAAVHKKLQETTPYPPDNSLTHNAFYLEAMGMTYQHMVLPSLEAGCIVILDSSDIRALAFMLDRGSDEAIDHTKEQILSGVVNCRIQPFYRLIMQPSSPDDLVSNLGKKDGLDKGDPREFVEVIRRIEKYQLAIEFFKILTANLGINWHDVSITHVTGNTEHYLSSVIEEQIMPLILR